MRYSTSSNGVPLKSALKVIANGTFGYSMYDFYCKCSSASRPTPTVIDIFDDHNIVILI